MTTRPLPARPLSAHRPLSVGGAAPAPPKPNINRPKRKLRIVLLLLGGVSWDDLATIATSTNINAPNLQSMLQESDLAMARLAGGPAIAAPNQNGGTISAPILRAAIAVSTGLSPDQLPPLPAGAAVTMGNQDRLYSLVPGYEDGPAGAAYTRRTGNKTTLDALVNLGLGISQDTAPGDLKSRHLGQLADAVQSSRGRTASFGCADTVAAPGIGLPLREWSVAAVNELGAIDAGDVSNRVLARDADSPFGVRDNRRALLQQYDIVATDPNVALITLECGDTRRAAMYAPLCAPRLTATYRRNALESADDLVKELLARLNTPADHLVLVAVPDLNTNDAQWLPLAMWQPRQRRDGSMLVERQRNTEAGVVSLESLYPTLVEKFGQASFLGAQPHLQPNGIREPASPRIARLMALMASAAWLDNVRPLARALLAIMLAGALAISCWQLLAGSSRDTRVVSYRLQLAVVGFAMALPLLYWLAGAWLQVSWHFGAASPRGSGYVLSLFCLAWLIIGGAVGIACWFYPSRLHRVRIGILWFAMTLIGLIIGGFALPWNAVYGGSLLDGTRQRCGDLWSLLLISATMLSIAGLTRSWYKGPSLPDAEAEARLQRARRVINLRPAGYWSLLVLILLAWDQGGGNRGALLVGTLSFGTLWLRLWLHDHEPSLRVLRRHGTLALIIIGSALLLWQQGGAVGFQRDFQVWQREWMASWHQSFWSVAFITVLICCTLFLTALRPMLRTYLQTRYSTRAMISGCFVGGIAALALYGSYGLILLVFYPLLGMVYEILGAEQLREA